MRAYDTVGTETDASGAVCGVRTASGFVHRADKVLIAAGPWTPSLVPELAGLIQVVGQPLIYVRVPEPLRPSFSGGAFPPFAADISRQGWYGFPANGNDGYRIKVGLHGNGFLYEGTTADGRICSMPAPPEARARPPPAVVKQIKDFVDRSFPALRDQPVDESRLCYYCDSWDSYFYIDAVPGRRNLYVATGGSGTERHERHKRRRASVAHTACACGSKRGMSRARLQVCARPGRHYCGCRRGAAEPGRCTVQVAHASAGRRPRS